MTLSAEQKSICDQLNQHTYVYSARVQRNDTEWIVGLLNIHTGTNLIDDLKVAGFARSIVSTGITYYMIPDERIAEFLQMLNHLYVVDKVRALI